VFTDTVADSGAPTIDRPPAKRPPSSPASTPSSQVTSTNPAPASAAPASAAKLPSSPVANTSRSESDHPEEDEQPEVLEVEAAIESTGGDQNSGASDSSPDGVRDGESDIESVAEPADFLSTLRQQSSANRRRSAGGTPPRAARPLETDPTLTHPTAGHSTAGRGSAGRGSAGREGSKRSVKPGLYARWQATFAAMPPRQRQLLFGGVGLATAIFVGIGVWAAFFAGGASDSSKPRPTTTTPNSGPTRVPGKAKNRPPVRDTSSHQRSLFSRFEDHEVA
jgi:hypothetical protein